MKLSTLTASILVSIPSLALAATPQKPERESGTIYADGTRAAPRTLTDLASPSAREALARFQRDAGGGWRADFDLRTGVPARLWGGKIEVPGSVASARIAEQAARTVLAAHRALLAPGAAAEDLVLLADDLTDGLRTVSFAQRHQGLPIEGAQISFRFKNDRLFVIGSEAWPNVSSIAPATLLDRGDAEPRAVAFVRAATGIEGKAIGFSGPIILPIAADGAPPSDRAVVVVTVRSTRPTSSWAVYLDARTGAPIARRQTLMFTDGTVKMNAPIRRPGATRQDFPAQGASITINGAPATADANGLVTWAGAGPAQVMVQAVGPLVKVINATGTASTGSFLLQPGGSVVWDRRSVELVDAQIISYVASETVKGFVRHIAPGMTWLTSNQLQVNVNIDDVCNAFSDGETTNFFKSGQGCENTGRIPDVVYHEFGHAFHNHAIIMGVGRFDTSLSEGASDFLAASITGDPGTARGFFFDDTPLRDLDPPGVEKHWPEDIDRDPHNTGLIFAGAMWDLRKGLIAALGMDAGIARTEKLYYGALQRAADIPTSYVEVLATDDDDGDLSNGTPNVCVINAAFQAHGLVDVMKGGPGLSYPQVVNGLDITLPVMRRDSCPGSEVSTAIVTWEIRGEPGSGGTFPLSADAASWAGRIPAGRRDIVVRWKLEVTLGSGEKVVFPTNPADPMYEAYVGDVTPIFCTDFEAANAADGWTHRALTTTATGSDDWKLGVPMASATSGDPPTAHSGMNVFGNNLGGDRNDGRYVGNAANKLSSPMIDVHAFPEVRLQYFRWLTVEDGVADKATILANDQPGWTNFTGTSSAPGAVEVNHIDREWRFQDLDLTPMVQGGMVQVSFELQANRRRRYGGWNIDDFCIVGVSSRCGNGMVEAGEACDDGNNVSGDGCEADCTLPRAVCGNGRVEAGEACDDGNTAGGDGCEANCTLTPAACGNGVVEAGEDCDDGVLDGTACAPGCVLPEIKTAKSSCGCATTGETTGSGSGAVGLLIAIGLSAVVRRRRR